MRKLLKSLIAAAALSGVSIVGMASSAPPAHAYAMTNPAIDYGIMSNPGPIPFDSVATYIWECSTCGIHGVSQGMLFVNDWTSTAIVNGDLANSGSAYLVTIVANNMNPSHVPRTDRSGVAEFSYFS